MELHKSKPDIMKLREVTGCGVLDCKKALYATGDHDKAIEWLRNRKPMYGALISYRDENGMLCGRTG